MSPNPGLVAVHYTNSQGDTPTAHGKTYVLTKIIGESIFIQTLVPSFQATPSKHGAFRAVMKLISTFFQFSRFSKIYTYVHTKSDRV